MDVDLDGYEDLLITTGFERDVQDRDIAAYLEHERRAKNLSDLESLKRRRLFPRLDPPNVAFRNRGDLTFEEAGQAWGFDLRGVSQGMALADLDNDGDLDVVINNLNAQATVLRNDSPAPRLAVRLRGKPPNTAGIGAKIKVTSLGVPESGGTRPRSRLPVQTQEMICGGRYLSGDDTMRVFAAGNATNEFAIEVTWRNGTRSLVKATANHLCEIDEAGAVVPPPASSTLAAGATWFQDVSPLLSHTHQEAPFDDFERQPLLPKRLSQLGPGVAWCDLDGDGDDDLIIGSGKGGALAVFENDGQGGFRRPGGPPFNQAVTRDQTTILGLTAGSGLTQILAGSANFEDGLTNGSSVRVYDLQGKSVADYFPGQTSSTGPLALADVDGDGDLDLFVGGRTVPGRYPEPAASQLFLFDSGQWTLDRRTQALFNQLGLVSGAVFSDLNGDGYPELILACEWGPVRVFANEKGQFTETTQALGLSSYRGWWNGVTTGDLDGDGRLDIIASNWGRNTKYQDHREQPLRLFYGDLDEDGSVDIIEAYFDRGMGKIVPWQTWDRMGESLLLVRTRFLKFQEYGRSSVAEILGDRMKSAKELQATWLESTVFFNRGNHFEARPLPTEAQLSPAFAVCVADLDGDGNEDLFLSQNFFATEPRTGRYDAGRGLWLRGDGQGGMKAVPARESGIRVYGEQRGAAVADYDGDGRADLVVTQNGAATKLFHNVRAKPGLRLRLQGGPANPTGIGASVRLIYGEHYGPAREIHAGSGYWAQESAVPVMGTQAAPSKVWVRWPGGQTNMVSVPPDAREVQVDRKGNVEALK